MARRDRPELTHRPQGVPTTRGGLLRQIQGSVFPGPVVPKTDRERAWVTFNTLLLHLRPVRLPARTLRWSHTTGLGGTSLVLVGVLMATGMLMMLVYQPVPGVGLRVTLWDRLADKTAGPRRPWNRWRPHMRRSVYNRPSVDSLDLSDCTRLLELPGDLPADLVEVAGSGVTKAPDHLRLSWRGVEVPRAVVLDPESLTAEAVFGEPNFEVRRVMLKRLDPARLLRRRQVDVVDEDRDAGGELRLLRIQLVRAAYQFLECRCPSTRRVFHLRVPPDLVTCHQAAAWVAGFDRPEDYAPRYET